VAETFAMADYQRSRSQLGQQPRKSSRRQTKTHCVQRGQAAISLCVAEIGSSNCCESGNFPLAQATTHGLCQSGAVFQINFPNSSERPSEPRGCRKVLRRQQISRPTKTDVRGIDREGRKIEPVDRVIQFQNDSRAVSIWNAVVRGKWPLLELRLKNCTKRRFEILVPKTVTRGKKAFRTDALA
jgi:hypothetical protein